MKSKSPNILIKENNFKEENIDKKNYIDYFDGADYSKFLSEKEYKEEKDNLSNKLHETMYELYIKKYLLYLYLKELMLLERAEQFKGL